jgi:hypothetical protein
MSMGPLSFCFRYKNNLFSWQKQLVFNEKTTCFQRENKLKINFRPVPAPTIVQPYRSKTDCSKRKWAATNGFSSVVAAHLIYKYTTVAISP